MLLSFLIVLLVHFRKAVQGLDNRIHVAGVPDIVYPCVSWPVHWLRLLLITLSQSAQGEIKINVDVYLGHCFLCLLLSGYLNAQHLEMVRQ